MKKLTILIASLSFALLSFNVQAHGFQNNRFGTFISFSSGFNHPGYYSSYYPSNSLVSGITYRNRSSFIGLQNRHYNGRFSTNRAYQNGYRKGYNNGYSDANRVRGNRIISGSNYHRSDRRISYGSTCYESYYDRFGNYAERSLPASACRY